MNPEHRTPTSALARVARKLNAPLSASLVDSPGILQAPMRTWGPSSSAQALDPWLPGSEMRQVRSEHLDYTFMIGVARDSLTRIALSLTHTFPFIHMVGPIRAFQVKCQGRFVDVSPDQASRVLATPSPFPSGTIGPDPASPLPPP